MGCFIPSINSTLHYSPQLKTGRDRSRHPCPPPCRSGRGARGHGAVLHGAGTEGGEGGGRGDGLGEAHLEPRGVLREQCGGGCLEPTSLRAPPLLRVLQSCNAQYTWTAFRGRAVKSTGDHKYVEIFFRGFTWGACCVQAQGRVIQPSGGRSRINGCCKNSDDVCGRGNCGTIGNAFGIDFGSI